MLAKDQKSIEGLVHDHFFRSRLAIKMACSRLYDSQVARVTKKKNQEYKTQLVDKLMEEYFEHRKK